MMFFLVAIMSVLASATAETEPITDVNIHTAVAEWVNDKAAAKEIYGEISLWKTGDVTNMADLFANLESFDEDISKWNVSKVTNLGYVSMRARISPPLPAAPDAPPAPFAAPSTRTHRSLFYGAKAFRGDLSEWIVSSAVLDSPSSYMFPGLYGCFDCAKAPVALVSHCTQYAVGWKACTSAPTAAPSAPTAQSTDTRHI